MILVFGNINAHIYAGLDAPLKAREGNFSSQNHALELSGTSAIHAVSAARGGAKVALVATVGNDIFGKHCLETLRKEGINTSGIGQNKEDTGIEISLNEPNNDRTVIISEGANKHTHAMQIPDIHMSERSLLLLSDDTNEVSIQSLLNHAQKRNTRSVLCLSDNNKLSADTLLLADIIIANEKTVRKPKNDHVVITKNQGIDGAAAYSKKGNQYGYEFPEPIQAQDMNACYEVFCGFFAACIQAGIAIDRAIELASKASRATSQKQGLYKSIPYLGYIGDIENKSA